MAGNSGNNTIVGELRAVQNGVLWTIEADTDGDRIADFVLTVTADPGYPIGAGDFLL